MISVDAAALLMVNNERGIDLNCKFEKKRLKQFLGSDMYDLLHDCQAIIAGGFITSLFTNSPINNVDLYFRKESHALALAEEMWRGDGWFTFVSDKSLSFAYKENNYQVIHFKYYESPESVFESFDFTACMGAYDFKTEEFVFHDDFIKHNSQKLLKFNDKTDFPLISLFRTKKYQERGYFLSPTEMMKIGLTCNRLKIESYDELKDQLGGMYGLDFTDVFAELIDKPFDMNEVLIVLDQLPYTFTPNSDSGDNEVKSFDELFDMIVKTPIRYAKIGHKYLWDMHTGLKSKKRKPANGELVDVEKLVKTRTFYKFVKKVGDVYFSYYQKHFRYENGKEVTSNHPGIYVVTKDNIHSAPYQEFNDSHLIEVYVDPEDIINYDLAGHFQVKKCKVVREVNKGDMLTDEIEPF